MESDESLKEKLETEAALAIQKVQQVQTRFTTFFEQSTFAMEIISLAGDLVAVNKAWEDLFQTPREKIVGLNVFHDPQIKSADFMKYLKRAYLGESVEVPSFYYEPKLNGAKGKARWLEAWISPVKDDQGSIREMAMILKDVSSKVETEQALIRSISERKATEEKYRIISERYALAAQAGNIGHWEWTPGTSYVKWDETSEAIHGISKGKFAGTTNAFNDAIHPEDRQYLWATISESLTKRTSYCIDYRALTPEWKVRWIQGSGTALYDETGHPFHMIGTVIDITDRKDAEQDQKFLSQASEYLLGSFDYREILHNLCHHANQYFCDGSFIDQLLPDGNLERMMVVHPDPVICDGVMRLAKIQNPYIKPLEDGVTMFNKSSEDFFELIRTTHSEEYFQLHKMIGKKSSICVRLKGHGKVLGLMTFFVKKDSKKELLERHVWLAEELAYRASMAFENVLIHQNSLEAIRSRDEFLSIASHELKTPLQSLTLQNQMRKRNVSKSFLQNFSSEKFNSMIDADLRHLSRIKRLIEDMLDISRIRAGKLTFVKEKFEMCAFVKDVIDRFRPQMDAAGCLATVSYCRAHEVNADMYRIEQVLVNILTNAVKYGSSRPIQIAVESKGEAIRVLVKDLGAGIKEQDMERIFERFERAISSNEVSGLGLGLYISRQIMEQHDGRLFAESTFGSGSTFILELPLENES